MKIFRLYCQEFKAYCERSAHKIFFLSVTPHYLEEYKKQGFGFAKCGEEARFALTDYEISGKKGAKMRMNINHATKGRRYGMPSTGRWKNAILTSSQAFDRVTDEWLGQKKSSLLSFTMGTAGLENPMDKRYFYARDEG